MSKRGKPLDYTSMRKKGDKAPAESPRSGNLQRKWWTMTGEECAQSIESVVKALQMAQSARIRQCALSMRLYGNFAMFGATGAMYARAMSSTHSVKDRMTDNVIQSVIDTVHSKIMEDKPRPYFLTSGGNYRQQRKAKKLNQFEEGNFYENKTYEKGGLASRDGMVFGDGLIHVFARAGKIRHERTLSSEIWVDETEAQYGSPRTMFRVKDVDRDELAEAFHEKRDAILKASRSTDKYSTTDSTLSDMVKVVEAWHLGAEDDNGELNGGKHAIALISDSTMLLEPEEWEHPFFPFAKMPWCPRLTGYWSQGLAEQLQGDQIELNKELFHIQRSLHIAGSIKVFLKNGSKVVKETLNNEIGGIVTYTGDMPSYQTPAPIHPIYLENPARIRARMFDKAGVSEMSAGGRKPAGLDSGRALREAQDIESDRFKTTARYKDTFYLDIAALDVAIAMTMDKVDRVRVPGKGRFEEINLKKDIGSLKDSEFVLQCFPVSRLPKDPAGRLSTIQEYIQAGFITQRQGRRALDFPDLDSVESLANAQEDIVSQTLDDIVYDGEYAPPEPTDDLKMAKEMVIEYIQRLRIQGLESEKLNMLRNWNQQVDALIGKTMTMPAPAPVDGMGAPAVPEAPETSDMLPNAAGGQPGEA